MFVAASKNKIMSAKEFKVGQILEVTTKNGIHYEKVIQTDNEVVTETMQEWEDEEIS